MATQDSDEREKLIDKLMEREGFKPYGIQRYCIGKHTQPCGCYFANQREHYGNLADFILQDSQAAIDKAVAEARIEEIEDIDQSRSVENEEEMDGSYIWCTHCHMVLEDEGDECACNFIYQSRAGRLKKLREQLQHTQPEKEAA